MSNNLVVILVALLAFAAIAGIGFAFTSGQDDAARKRTRAIGSGRSTAVSKAAFVMMSRGLMSCLMHCSSASTARSTSSVFSGWSPPWPLFAEGSHAGMEDEYGTDMPSASIADAIVFAVYMPPQAPGPGHDDRTTSSRVLSSILPATNSPYAWNAEMMSSFSSIFGRQPARIVPPYTITLGRLKRAIAMMQPGMFLSQPGIEMLAS